jgi:hypothetical protein
MFKTMFFSPVLRSKIPIIPSLLPSQLWGHQFSAPFGDHSTEKINCLEPGFTGTRTWLAGNLRTKSGWWLNPNPSEKYELVSWDDDIPNIWKVIKAMFQTTNQ